MIAFIDWVPKMSVLCLRLSSAIMFCIDGNASMSNMQFCRVEKVSYI